MLKYSDVIGNGLASASAFFDDISEAGGEKSLDVQATINNRLIEAPADPETHGYLEQEFLDAATRRAVTRSRLTHGMRSLVFTRAGAAINLKLLIAGAPYGNACRKDAIGKIALHANDYAESANTDRLKSGLLPIVAEFTAAWALNNAREIGPVLRRSYFIYDVLFKRDEAMRQLFQRELRTLPCDVEFAGLSFERYFQLIFATYAVAQASIRNWTSVVDILKSPARYDSLSRTFVLSLDGGFPCVEAPVGWSARCHLGKSSRVASMICVGALISGNCATSHY